MTELLKSLCRRLLQHAIILGVRPYVLRELPGWGRVYAFFVGDYRRSWIWVNAPTKTTRGKLHGYVTRLDLSNWVDRGTFFLGRWYDLGTQLFLTSLTRPGDTIVDIGANRGNFALIASRLVGDAGKVICFEPNPHCWATLDEQIASNAISNVIVHRVGLGNRDEERTLSVPFINTGEGTFGTSAYDDALAYQVRAEVRRGDEILANEHPALVKVDVEGFECNVIAGMANVIKQNRPVILTEIVPAHLSRCNASVEKLVSLIESFGYQGFMLSIVKRDRCYDWHLSPFAEQDHNVDAVWLHPDFLHRCAPFLDRHMGD